MSSQTKIIILAGEVNEGKTTFLANWINDKSKVHGLLTPKINSKRYFFDIDTRTNFQMEADASDGNNIVSIGKYQFSEKAFEKAKNILVNSISNEPNYLILDEIGPLELTGLGFNDTLIHILENITKSTCLILVVRNSFVEKVIEKYQLQNFKLSRINIHQEL